MSMMRALQFDQFGPPSVLSVREVPVPSPPDGEVLVQIAATSINPSDVKNVEGRLGATLPRIAIKRFERWRWSWKTREHP
jgi:NADPH2:quinone reductase